MNLFVFGLGYCAQHFIHEYGHAFAQIAGTVRDLSRPRPLLGSTEILRFSPEVISPAIEDRLRDADVILTSIAPGTSVDPVLTRFGRRLASIKRPQKVLYLSTVGVYGDHGGEWVDEDTLPMPQSDRSKVRVHAEKSWATLAKDRSKTVHILRLAGIYGPARNPFVNLAAGRAHRYIKPGQVFNRIHVEDIARTCAALVAYTGESDVWNVTDDEPAPPQDVVTYAADIMGVAPPPEQDFELAELTPMARSFYNENKRCSNRKIKEVLGVELAYPTYREGLQALWADGEGREILASRQAASL